MMPPEKFIAGYDKERQKLNYFVIEGFPLGFVKGETGAGKTTLLLWLWHVMQQVKEKRALFYTEKLHKGLLQFILEHLIDKKEKLGMKGYYGLGIHKSISFFKRKILKKTELEEPIHKKLHDQNYGEINKKDLFEYISGKLDGVGLVLMIDDVELLTEEDFELIVDLFKRDITLQVVAAGTKDSIENCKLKGFKKDDLRIFLQDMSFEDAKRMVEKRISFVGGKGIDPFNEHQLKAIYASADKNPKMIIKKCLDQSIKRALKRMTDSEKAWDKEKWVAPSKRNKPKKEEPIDLNEQIKTIEMPIKKKEESFEPIFVQEKSEEKVDYVIKVKENAPTDIIELGTRKRESKGYQIREVGEKPEKKVRKIRKLRHTKRVVRRVRRTTSRKKTRRKSR